MRDTGIGIPPSGHGASLPALRPSRCFHGAAFRRHGPRAFHLQEPGGDDGRAHLGRKRSGQGKHVLLHRPAAFGEGTPCRLRGPGVLPAAACAQLRILLVEDNPANQKLATYILQDRGHLVEIAGDGQEAVYLTEQNRYDVILMDVQMPGMNGLEATAAIRKCEAEKGTGPICVKHPPGRSGKLDQSAFPRRMPIIAMTAHAMRGTAIAAWRPAWMATSPSRSMPKR